MKPHFIFTADDFGPVDFINNGIIQCVQAGAINSVQVLVNFDGVKLISELQRLCDALQPNQELEVGIHYTLMSGSPLYPSTNEQELRAAWSNIITKKKINGESRLIFRAFNKFYWKIFNYQRSREYYGNTIFQELKLQRTRLEEAIQTVNGKASNGKKLKLTSASNHFNLFTVNITLLDAYLKASEGLTIRSPRMIPAKSGKLLVGVYLPLSNPNDTKQLNKKARKLEKHYGDYMFYGNKNLNIKSPAYLDSRFFFSTGKLLKKTLGGIKGRKRKFNNMLKAASHFNPSQINQQQTIVEVVFHLGTRSSGDSSSFSSMTKHYPGITYKYFDNREVEFKSLLSLVRDDEYKSLFQNQLVSWTTCKEPIVFKKLT
jgi:hypothetical protein